MSILIDCDYPGFWGGLGDTVCLAWLAAAPENEITLATGCGTKQAVLTLLGIPWVTHKTGAVAIHDAYTRELRERCQLPRLQYGMQRLGVGSIKRPTPNIPAAEMDWARNEVKNIGEPFVMLFPQTRYRAREWPAPYWIDLASQLNAHGVRAKVFIETRESRFNDTSSYWGHSLPRLAALMSLASVVVGNDSMPAHLAGTLDRPTIAILGPTRPNVFAHAPSVTCIEADKLIVECGGCHFGTPFRKACDQGCRALFSTQPERVADHVFRMVDQGSELDSFAKRLRDIFHIRDAGHFREWLPSYRVLLEEVKNSGAAACLEFGMRAGYSGWVMLEAGAKSVVSIDHFRDSPAFEAHATRLTEGRDWSILKADLATLCDPPLADLVYVDADHSRDGCYRDLCLAAAAKPATILLDDVSHFAHGKDITAAANRFCADYGWTMRTRDNGLHGLGVLTHG